MKLNIIKRASFFLASFFTVNAYAEDLIKTGFQKTYPMIAFFLTTPGVFVFLIIAIVSTTLIIKLTSK